MKVQHITENWVCGGIESLLIDLCAATEAKGFRNSLAFLYQDQCLRGKPATPVPTAGVRMIRRLRIDPCGLWRLRNILLAERPDVLHCHAFYPAASALALRAAGIHIPIVYTVHANLDRGVQRSDALAIRVARACENVVAVSAKTAESIQRFTNGRVAARVITNGMNLARIDSPRFFSPEEKRRSAGIAEGTTVFSMVAALTNQKDHPTLLRAFANLVAGGGDFALLVIGDGPERLALEAMARELSLGDAVTFLGKRDDIPEWLAISQVFVLASHSEGLPISIVEASCAGLPVVATDVGGVSDLLTMGIDIRLTRHFDVDDLTTALRETAVRQPPEVTDQRRSRAREIFSIERAAEQYADIYQELGRKRCAA